jgi:hypothetical protein
MPPRNFTEYGDVRAPARPDADDPASPDEPPDRDDVADHLPIPERGWNTIEGDHDAPESTLSPGPRRLDR